MSSFLQIVSSPLCLQNYHRKWSEGEWAWGKELWPLYRIHRAAISVRQLSRGWFPAKTFFALWDLSPLCSRYWPQRGNLGSAPSQSCRHCPLLECSRWGEELPMHTPEGVKGAALKAWAGLAECGLYPVLDVLLALQAATIYCGQVDSHLLWFSPKFANFISFNPYNFLCDHY